MKNKLVTVLGIGGKNITLVQAEVAADSTRLVATATAAAQVPDGCSKEQEGEALAAAIKTLENKYAISRTRLVAVLPRYQVFMRKVTMPPGNDAEIRGMLRFEADKYIPFPTDKAVLDYYPCNIPQGSTVNDIILLAVKRETVEKCLDIFSGAGLFPEEISVTAVALSSLFPRLPGAIAGNAALIGISDDALEIDLFIEKRLVLSRGVPMRRNDAAPSLVLQELHNTLSALGTVDNSGTITKVYGVSAKEDESLFSHLSDKRDFNFETLNLTTATIRDMAMPAGASVAPLDRYAGLLGVLFESSHRVNLVPADILARYRQKMRRKYFFSISGVAAGALAVLLGIGSAVHYHHSSGQREMTRKMNSMEPEIIQLRKIDEKLSLVDRFAGNRKLPLRILKELCENMPRNAYLHQFQYDRVEGTLLLRGRTNSYATASNVVAQMGRSPYFSQIINKGARMIKAGETNLVDFEIQCILKDVPGNEKAE